MKEISAFAPASIGNIGVGFDIMGLALNGPGDEVVVRKSIQKGLRITQITGDGGKLPLEVEKNTAGVAALRFLESVGLADIGIEMEVHKYLPLGSGLGSSAASAAAAVLAVGALLETGKSKEQLLPFACLGEQVASGGFHADNIAPALLGGIILIRDNPTLDIHRLPVPTDLTVAVVHPHIEVLTKEARAILQPTVPLKDYVRQSANVGAFIVGLFNSDFGLIGRSLRDIIIEPQRAGLIQGFYEVQAAAMASGALGCSISGAGPSVFAMCANVSVAEQAAVAMQDAFAKQGIESDIIVSSVNQEGAVLK